MQWRFESFSSKRNKYLILLLNFICHAVMTIALLAARGPRGPVQNKPQYLVVSCATKTVSRKGAGLLNATWNNCVSVRLTQKSVSPPPFAPRITTWIQ